MVGENELQKMNRKQIQKKEVIVSSRSSYHQPRGMLNKNRLASETYVRQNTFLLKNR